MPLSRLLPLLAALLTLATLALVGRLAVTEWQTYRRAGAGWDAVQQLKLGLVAAEMVSRERGPTNAVLGDVSPARPARHQALAAARQRSDAALAAVQRTFLPSSGDPLRRDAVQGVAMARIALDEARAAVDLTAGLPLGERRPETIRERVHGMVRIVPMLAPAIGLLANDAQQAYPALAGDVQGARLVAELREYAGLLGSLFTPALARQEPFEAVERSAIDRTRGRIDELRFLVDLRVQVPGQGASVSQAWQIVEDHYFGQAGRLLQGVIAAGLGDGRYGLDPGAFAEAYVPDMNTLFVLRDVLLDQASANAAAERERAVRALIGVGAGSALLLGLMGTAMLQIRRRVLQPLARTTQALHALARNELDAPLPIPRANDEFAAVIGAVSTLQEQTRQREALEDERDDLIDRLRDMSNTDFLTGLPNRRAFLAAAEADLAKAGRHGFGVVAILLDIDRFKQFNDELGHAAGDKALIEVAHTVRRSLRLGDLVARYGGEEYVLLLSHCDRHRGLRFAERLRLAIAAASIVTPSGALMHVTASLGIADSERHGLDLEALLSRADAAMYRAKDEGRNRVVLADDAGLDKGESAEPQAVGRQTPGESLTLA